MPWHGSGAWRNGQLSADFVVDRIGEASGHDATIVADVGQNQMWTARYAGFRRPNSHISSGGLARWVRAAGGHGRGSRPAREGDLGHRRRWRPPDDGSGDDDPRSGPHSRQDRAAQQPQTGHGPQWQELVYAGNYHSSHLLGPDWCKLAEAYGIPGFQASTPDEVDSAIAAARAVDGPALVEFVIAAEQNVFPMMPAGKGLSDLLEEQFEEPKQ